MPLAVVLQVGLHRPAFGADLKKTKRTEQVNKECVGDALLIHQQIIHLRWRLVQTVSTSRSLLSIVTP